MRNIKFLLLLVLFNAILNALSAQHKYRSLNVPVYKNGVRLIQPWHGGFNSPQFSVFDLNEDGISDLFVFDRVGNKVYTYINRGGNTDTTYQYAPAYELMFPSELNNWALIRDYNYDGVPDIFCKGPLGISAYKGFKDGNKLKFELLQEVVSYTSGIYSINIWVSIDDIPVITDVNRDGDLDVLSFGLFGSAVEYYENQTQENIGNPSFEYDSLKFIQASACWGRFTEAQMNNTIILNDPSCLNGLDDLPPAGIRHAGSTLFDLDYDNDHDVDLLIGDIAYPTLTLVRNCGDSSWANVCSFESGFPACDAPVTMQVFPAAFPLDANNDGLMDLVVAPNARTSAQDVNNLLLYKNTGNPTCPYVFESDSFLTKQFLDFGTGSRPVLFDFNYDGLQDIVVCNYGYFRPGQTYKSSLALLKNTGTATNPAFELLSTDYFGIGSYNLLNIHAAFGDLDGDGKQDMLLGESNGYLHFLKNTGGLMANFSALTTPEYFQLDVGQYSTPFIFDVNGDSLPDIVCGKRDGTLTFYPNLGTKTAPYFHNDSANHQFGKIRVNLNGGQIGNSVPFLRRNENNEIELYVGSFTGYIYKYRVNPDSIYGGSFELLSDNAIGVRLGVNSAVLVTDLNGDGKMDYVCGSETGGLSLYSDTILDPEDIMIESTGSAPDYSYINIFPNPARDFLWLQTNERNFYPSAIRIVDINGREQPVSYTVAGSGYQLNVQHLLPGIYLLMATVDYNFLYTRFVVTR